MTETDGALFSMAEDPLPVEQPLPIRDYQVGKIREAFEAAGIMDQASRKDLIESCVRREIASLRDLYATEVRHILMRIEAKASATPSSGSAWDNRTEDTWIDRL